MKSEIVKAVRAHIGPHASPEKIPSPQKSKAPVGPLLTPAFRDAQAGLYEKLTKMEDYLVTKVDGVINGLRKRGTGHLVDQRHGRGGIRAGLLADRRVHGSMPLGAPRAAAKSVKGPC